jgi:hypothetical protein
MEVDRLIFESVEYSEAHTSARLSFGDVYSESTDSKLSNGSIINENPTSPGGKRELSNSQQVKGGQKWFSIDKSNTMNADTGRSKSDDAAWKTRLISSTQSLVSLTKNITNNSMTSLSHLTRGKNQENDDDEEIDLRCSLHAEVITDRPILQKDINRKKPQKKQSFWNTMKNTTSMLAIPEIHSNRESDASNSGTKNRSNSNDKFSSLDELESIKRELIVKVLQDSNATQQHQQAALATGRKYLK